MTSVPRLLGRCTCQAISLNTRLRVTPVHARQYAQSSKAQAPAVDRLLLAARKLLADAAQANDGGIEAAKRDRELQGIKRALTDVEQGKEVSRALTSKEMKSEALPFRT